MRVCGVTADVCEEGAGDGSSSYVCIGQAGAFALNWTPSPCFVSRIFPEDQTP